MGLNVSLKAQFEHKLAFKKKIIIINKYIYIYIYIYKHLRLVNKFFL